MQAYFSFMMQERKKFNLNIFCSLTFVVSRNIKSRLNMPNKNKNTELQLGPE